MASLRNSLTDRAYFIRREADARRVEGRTMFNDRSSPHFQARLLLDGGAEATDPAGIAYTTESPGLLAHVVDSEREHVKFQPDDRVVVESRDFTPGREWGQVGVYQVDGEATPIRRLRNVVGWQVRLKRVDESPATEARTR